MKTHHATNSDAQTCDIAAPAAAGTRCPACGAGHLSDFYTAKRVPVHVGNFYDGLEEARRAPLADITLAYCHACEFIHNRDFDVNKTAFQPGYEVSLSHSATFRAFLESVCARLVDRFDLRGKSILEIGCGDGYFLRLLCTAGGNHGIGVDPTVVDEGQEPAGSGSVTFIRDFFSKRYDHLQPDFVCCLSVFEAIPNVLEFLKDLRNMLGDRPVGLYFEVFNAFRAIAQQETWSVHYEQCNYFSERSLTNLFARSGFQVTETRTCYQGDQYVYVDAVVTDVPAVAAGDVVVDHPCETQRLPDRISAFGAKYEETKACWQRQLAEFAAAGKKVVVWGTGGKGVGFLNALPTFGQIEFVVDINPDKHGKYVPGSAQQIVAPESLVEYRPDVIVLTNALYEAEIKQQVSELGVQAEFLLA